MSSIAPWSPAKERSGQITKVAAYGITGAVALCAGALIGRTKFFSQLNPKALLGARIALLGIGAAGELAAITSLIAGVDSRKSKEGKATSDTDSEKAKSDGLRRELFNILNDKDPDLKEAKEICKQLTAESLQEPWGKEICKDHPRQGPLHEVLYRLVDAEEKETSSHVKVLKVLLKAGAAASHDPREESPIEIAVRELKGDLQDGVVGHLMNHGARFPTWATSGAAMTDVPGCELTEESLRLYDETWAEDRELLEYAQEGNARAMKALLAKGCHPDLRDKEGTGETALAIAVRQGHTKAVKTLLKAKASLTQADGPSALHITVEADEPDLQIVQMLLDAGANPLHLGPYSQPPLHRADIRHGSESELVKLLVEHVCDRHVKRLRSLRGARVAPPKDKRLSEKEKVKIKEDLVFEFEKEELDPKAIQNLAKKLGSALDKPLTNGRSALQQAILVDNKEIARTLLEEGANPNASSRDGKTAFHTALELLENPERDQMIELLLEYGAWIPSQKLSNMSEDTSQSCFDLVAGQCVVDETFREGVDNGDTKAVKRYLKDGFPVDFVDYARRDESTALMDACAKGHTNIVRLLLKAGARVDLRRERDGASALHVAVSADEPDLKIVKMLLDAGANPLSVSPDGQSLLRVAEGNAKAGNSLVELLVNHVYKRHVKRLHSIQRAEVAPPKDKRLDEKDKAEIKEKLIEELEKDTPDAKAVRKLAKQLGSALDEPLAEGEYPALCLPVLLGDTKVARVLLKVGADPNVSSHDGKTAFHVALEKLQGAQLDKMVKLLLKYGARIPSYNLPEAKDSMSRSCIELVLGQIIVDQSFQEGAEEGDAKAVKRYLKAGFPVDFADYERWNGATALIMASARSRTEVVQILLEAGADPSFRDQYGKCAIDYVGLEEIKQLLQRYGEQDASGSSSSS